ncbi:hypothetical protein JQ607_30330 [Bradyrhizobium liaoningense]|uniref:hypothetical protein n=1 Tax=Bradyrhizobium liaoningense TaxID=43992 RepID=UPI001BA958BB|nr:hypothetical protein [Bradyrhizobium liaoningense]MBR0844520.1 hypothetical protein [Bradyrhizobium liaoningense]
MSHIEIHRVHEVARAVTEVSARIRDTLALCREVLSLPLPDTFLGRKTREPFPEERNE